MSVGSGDIGGGARDIDMGKGRGRTGIGEWAHARTAGGAA